MWILQNRFAHIKKIFRSFSQFLPFIYILYIPFRQCYIYKKNIVNCYLLKCDTCAHKPLQALLADTYSVRDTKVHENGKVSKFTNIHKYTHIATPTNNTQIHINYIENFDWMRSKLSFNIFVQPFVIILIGLSRTNTIL